MGKYVSEKAYLKCNTGVDLALLLDVSGSMSSKLSDYGLAKGKTGVDLLKGFLATSLLPRFDLSLVKIDHRNRYSVSVFGDEN